ncbi:TetR family transcriptional regulator [Curtobacterium sp. MCBD17_013]|uniref:TetR/AcrR family transcriptional regulator C-terminal domain-containing protein n=1 Tax=Curtobacterium sp. MCBD17_013 TaxID=2175668 RepID=UPI000DA7D36B|nr:TetR/AcrR family transcriptional regulator C-terminal domain-containing protein [Curtobacterium sp. MCBD17_013]PZF61528.1 TetR family transcriptional regulator [Curtobacterium sp. MCBD17_013]
MTKINRQLVVAEALDLLDEVGLDGVSTRRLAQRLGVEQPALYWHFKRKEDLLIAMAEAAMQPQTSAPLPEAGDDWQEWFLENYRRFRRTLLLHRDGARLHAGTFPSGGDLEVLLAKIAFLSDNGIPAVAAQSAMMAAGQLTLGNALEAQAADDAPPPPGLEAVDHAQGFEAGLRLLVSGLAQQRHEVHPA